MRELTFGALNGLPLELLVAVLNISLALLNIEPLGSEFVGELPGNSRAI
jgi:hypothetical protein